MSDESTPATGTACLALIDDGGWRSNFGVSVLHLFLHDLAHERRFFSADKPPYIYRMCSGPGLPEVRNSATEQFLEGGAEWLVCIDADMGFEPNAVDRLIATAQKEGAGIAGGLCFSLMETSSQTVGDLAVRGRRWDMQPTIFKKVIIAADPAKGRDHETVGVMATYDYEPGSVIECATGAAFIVVNRSVFEAIGGYDWWTPLRIEGGLPDGRDRTFSEDLSLMIRAAGVGVRVVVDTNVKTSHDKHGISLTEDRYQEWWAPRAALIEQRRKQRSDDGGDPE